MIIQQTTLDQQPAMANDFRVPLDPMHGGLQMTILGSFFASGVLGAGATLLLIPNGFLLAFIVGGAAAALTSSGLERALKHRWISGREFVANSDRIALTRHDKIETVINPQQQVNVLTWRFTVRKENPRAKKGWYVLCLGLEQDDQHIIVYTTISPDDFNDMPLSQMFVLLERRKKADPQTDLGSRQHMRKAGEQRRIHEAEVIRQFDGGDMHQEHFFELLQFLQATYPQWMIS